MIVRGADHNTTPREAAPRRGGPGDPAGAAPDPATTCLYTDAVRVPDSMIAWIGGRLGRGPAHLVGVLAVLLGAVLPSPAGEHRVTPGTDWSGLRVAPGDQIVLLPGEHLPASFTALRGTPDLPITIRGLDEKNPGIIAAQNFGLHLRSPRHLVLQDITVIGARHNGINIDDQDGSGSIGEPWHADLTLRRVSVHRTGPSGNTDGIKLSGLRSVRIEGCLVEGWGGSAVDLVGCHDVSIKNCTFRGLEGHGQSSGVQAKGGSTRLTISRSRFIDAGQRAVNLGGSTGLEYFRPPVPADAALGTWYEATDVTIERCVFVAGECAVAIVGARGAKILHCTIYLPRRWPFRLLQETKDPRFGPSEGPAVRGCLIVAPSLRTPVNVGPGTRPDLFRFEENLWWSPGARPEELHVLPGERVGNQVVADPALDADFHPTSPEAVEFGALR